MLNLISKSDFSNFASGGRNWAATKKLCILSPWTLIFVAAQLRPPVAKFEKSDLEIRLSEAQSIFCQKILGLKFILGAKKIF